MSHIRMVMRVQVRFLVLLTYDSMLSSHNLGYERWRALEFPPIMKNWKETGERETEWEEIKERGDEVERKQKEDKKLEDREEKGTEGERMAERGGTIQKDRGETKV